MPANDRIVLEQYLEQSRELVAPELTLDGFFTVFVCEQILKNQDLGYDELLAGIVDGGGDGGIDAIYCFVNGDLVQGEFDSSLYRNDPQVELVIVQAKRTSGFSEDAINRIVASCRHLLNLELDLTQQEYVRRYNAPLLELVTLFSDRLSRPNTPATKAESVILLCDGG